MSRITKTIAESVALKLSEPKKIIIDNEKLKLQSLVSESIKKGIPKEVLETFKKFPNYFRTHSLSNLNGVGFDYSNFRFESLPDDLNAPVITDKDGEIILSQSDLIKDLTKEYEKLKSEIEIALFGLRTYNKVEVEFPEAFRFLPKIMPTTLSVNLDSIRCKLDKKNCK